MKAVLTVMARMLVYPRVQERQTDSPMKAVLTVTAYALVYPRVQERQTYQ